MPLQTVNLFQALYHVSYQVQTTYKHFLSYMNYHIVNLITKWFLQTFIFCLIRGEEDWSCAPANSQFIPSTLTYELSSADYFQSVFSYINYHIVNLITNHFNFPLMEVRRIEPVHLQTVSFFLALYHMSYQVQTTYKHFFSYINYHIVNLTLFRSGGYQIDTCLPFSLYLRHGFCSESEQPDRNRVKQHINYIVLNFFCNLHDKAFSPHFRKG